jgi:hypothetical protein
MATQTYKQNVQTLLMLPPLPQITILPKVLSINENVQMMEYVQTLIDILGA